MERTADTTVCVGWPRPKSHLLRGVVYTIDMLAKNIASCYHRATSRDRPRRPTLGLGGDLRVDRSISIASKFDRTVGETPRRRRDRLYLYMAGFSLKYGSILGGPCHHVFSGAGQDLP